MTATPPRWDLTPLYQSIDDPQIGKDLSAAAMQARRFALRGQGKIAAMRPADFGQMIADYDRLNAKTDKVSAFAEMIYTAKNMEEMIDIANNKQGFIKAMWCGDEACEDKVKEVTGVGSRCIPLEQKHHADTCVCCGKPAKTMVIWGIQY